MARIVLVTLYDQGALGARHLSAYLKAHGHEASIVHFKRYRTVLRSSLENPPDEKFHEGLDLSGREVVMGISSGASATERSLFTDLLEELTPDLIGFSLRSITMETAALLSQDLRERLDVPIVWGGIGPTLEPQRSLDYCDYVCVGEGEEALLDLVEALASGNDPSGIPNIQGRARDAGARFQNPPRPLIRDLDSLPFADMAPEGKFTIDDDALVRDDPAVSNFRWLYETASSRGCPFACTYCCNEALHRLYAGEPRVRRRSPSHVLDELAQAVDERRVERINFQDDVFSMNARWLEEFSSQYRERVGVPFWCYVHPTGLKPAVLEGLRDAGLKWATLGIQSGSHRILQDVYGRKDQRSKIIETCALLRRLGIDVNVDIITNNPLETDQDCCDTLEMLCQLPRGVRLNAGLSKLSVFPGTQIGGIIDSAPPPERPPCHEAYNILFLASRQVGVPKGILLTISRCGFLMRRPSVLRPLLWPGRIWRGVRGLRDTLPALVRRILPETVWNALKRLAGRGNS